MTKTEAVKTGGWVSALTVTLTVLTMFASQMSGCTKPGPTPPPPLPTPDEVSPIVVQKEYQCEPGRTITIEPKFLGSIEWSVPPMYEKYVSVTPFPAKDKAVVNLFGTNTAYIAINGVYKDKDGVYVPSSIVYVKIFSANNPNPEPVPPTPNPNPPPVPPLVFPDGQFKLSAFSYNNVMSLVGQENRGVASALAKNYEGIAAKIAAGAYNTDKKAQENILKETTELNRASLKAANVAVATWEPFFNSLQNETYSLYENRKMVSLDDFKNAWQEISVGLSALRTK